MVHTDYSDAEFEDNSASITNKYSPYRPGVRLTYEGTADRGDGVTTHRVVLTVTDLVKEVDGVRSRVLWDVDTSDGVVAEAELALVAQDDDGNVWNMGEYPEEYEDGEFAGAPSTWLVGADDALAGVHMRRNPRPGTSEYLQALIESIEFGDIALIERVHPTFCIKLGCFERVVQIRETNMFVPDEGYQIKYHAPGVGTIRVDFAGGAEQETLELISIENLDRAEMKKARDAALRLDRRAYRFAPEIWGDSERAARGG